MDSWITGTKVVLRSGAEILAPGQGLPVGRTVDSLYVVRRGISGVAANPLAQLKAKPAEWGLLSTIFPLRQEESETTAKGEQPKENSMIPLSSRWVRRAVGLAWIVLAGALQAAPITDIFFFGDSLTDAGNAAILNSGPGSPPRSPVPYPEAGYTPVYVPPWTRPYETSGRFTDGFTWAQAFASALGFPGAAAPSGAGGNNYAVGGASVGSPASPPALPPSAVEQLAAFRVEHGGVTGSFDATALYFIGAGGNDLRSILTGAVSPVAGAAGIMGGYISMVTDLLSWGAQRIVLWNVPDITLSPQFRAAVLAGLISPADAAAFVGLVNQINANLDLLDALPGVDVFDLTGLLRSIVADPTAYGLLDAELPCGFVDVYSLTAGTCAQAFLFWDGVHPASGGHAALGRAMIAFVPEPATLWLAALALLGLVRLRRNGE